MSNPCFIITGAMGSGKSTLLQQLRVLGFTCVDEPARQILAEQGSIDGRGVPEKDPQRFTELMLSRAITQFKQMKDHAGPVFFDRGIPDNMGYAALFGLDLPATQSASQVYRYNKHVFIAKGWQAIYRTDHERKLSFEEARKFGEKMEAVYTALGYELLELPLASPESRAEFIVKTLEGIL